MLRSVRPRRSRAQRGFTLLELMYAFGYFMLGIAGLTFFHAVAGNATQHAADISMATVLTTNAIESTRNNPNITTQFPATVTTTTVFDRFGNAQNTNTYSGTPYFTVTSSSSQPSGVGLYYQTVVQTTWYQPPNLSFQHGVIMQTYIPTTTD